MFAVTRCDISNRKPYSKISCSLYQSSIPVNPSKSCLSHHQRFLDFPSVVCVFLQSLPLHDTWLVPNSASVFTGLACSNLSSAALISSPANICIFFGPSIDDRECNRGSCAVRCWGIENNQATDSNEQGKIEDRFVVGYRTPFRCTGSYFFTESLWDQVTAKEENKFVIGEIRHKSVFKRFPTLVFRQLSNCR